MTARLRLTVVFSTGQLGGAELWLLRLLRATDRLAVRAVLLADGPLRADLLADGVPVAVRPTGRGAADLAGAVRALAGRLRRGRPDLVLANGVKAAMVTAPAARLAGVRGAWVKHDHSYDGAPMRLLARLTDGCLATSAALAAASGRADTIVLPPTAPPPAAPHPAARRALGVPPDGPILLCAGRLVGYKGVDDAIRALAHPGGEHWRLVVAGAADPAEPAEPDRLRALAAEHRVADRVHLVGHRADLPALWPAVASVAALTRPDDPTGPGREGFGGTLWEAMAAGVPVVCTANGPAAGLVAPPDRPPAGIVVPPGSPVAVGAALGVLADPDRRAAMGTAGRAATAGAPTIARGADLLAAALARIACRPGAGLRSRRPISIVTTVRNEASTVDDLAAAILGQLDMPGDELVVVDGGSTDSTASIMDKRARRDPRLRPLSAPGAGISAGRNAGIAAARNGIVGCTDAGCRPVPGWVAALRDALAEPATPALVTGVYRVTGSDTRWQRAMAAVGYPDPDDLRWPPPTARGYWRLLGRGFDATLPTGRSMAFPVATWRAAGGFPEHLDTAEDVTFGRRAARLPGAAVLSADAEVGWTQRADLSSTAAMYFRYGVGGGRSGDTRLLARDAARAAAYLLAPPLFALGGTRTRLALAAATAAYLWLPLRRALTDDHPLPVVALLPPLAALRDLAKAAGAGYGLLRPGTGGAR